MDKDCLFCKFLEEQGFKKIKHYENNGFKGT